MPITQDQRGTTLLEVLISVAMVSVVVVTMTLILPRASVTITNNRRHWVAANFAAAGIQELKEQPYALLQTTPSDIATFPYVGGTNSVGGCDCAQANFSNVGNIATIVQDGITYSRRICVNMVDRAVGAWTPYCDDGTSATDLGMKKIRARVTWATQTDTFSTEIESMVIR